MLHGTSKISDDPVYDNVVLEMERALQARVEVPFAFNISCDFDAEIVPFYEHRRFGGREGYPFDFIDTQFDLLGMRVALTYKF